MASKNLRLESGENGDENDDDDDENDDDDDENKDGDKNDDDVYECEGEYRGWGGYWYES